MLCVGILIIHLGPLTILNWDTNQGCLSKSRLKQIMKQTKIYEYNNLIQFVKINNNFFDIFCLLEFCLPSSDVMH